MKVGYQKVEVNIESLYVEVVLNRVGDGNALDLTMVQDFYHAIEFVSKLKSIKTIVIRSEANVFCVGGDVKHIFANTKNPDAVIEQMLSLWHGSIRRLCELPATVLVVVEGSVAGGGLGLIVSADYILVSSDASFTAGFDRLGLNCDSGISWYLPRLIGLRKTKQFLMHGKVFDANEAYYLGLVDEVVPKTVISTRTELLVQKFSHYSLPAIHATKKLLNLTWENNLTQQMEVEKEHIKHCAMTLETKMRYEKLLTVLNKQNN